MTTRALVALLARAAKKDDPFDDFSDICAKLRSEVADVANLDVIMQFIEEHPDVDYGSPGPLIHYMEEFPDKPYEVSVLASLSRKPTPTTIWMLNRIANAAKGAHRAALLEAMRACITHPRSGPEEREAVEEFLGDEDAEPERTKVRAVAKRAKKAAIKKTASKKAAKKKAAMKKTAKSTKTRKPAKKRHANTRNRPKK